MALNYKAAVDIGANFTGKRSVEDAARSLRSLDATANQINASFSGATSVFKQFAGALALKEAISQTLGFGDSVIKLGAELDDLRQKTGINAQALSALQGAAAINGVEFGSLQGALKKFSVNVVGAANGNQELAGAFKAVGLQIKDSRGQLVPTGELLLSLSDKFNKLADGPEKAAIAVKLFGKSGADLIPLLNEGGEAISKFGLRITDDFVLRSAKLDDTITLISKNFKQLGVDAIEPLLPTLQELASALKDFTAAGSGNFGSIEILGEALRLVVIAGAGVVATFQTMGDAIGVVGLLGLDTIDLLGKAILNLGVALVDFNTNLFTKGFDAAGEAAGRYLQKQAADIDTYFKRAGKSGESFTDRLAERLEKTGNLVDKLSKNSIAFGNGGAGARADTAPKDDKRTGAADSAALDAEAAKKIQDAIKATQERINKIRAEAGALGDSNAKKQVAIELAELENRGILKGTEAYARLSSALRDAVNARELAKEKQSADDYAAKARQENELRALELRQVEFTRLEYEKLVDAKRREQAVSEATRRFTKEGAAAYRESAAAAQAQSDALKDLAQKQKETYGQGAKEALQEYVENAKNTAGQVKNLFSGALQKLEDSLVDFVKTGKLNFADLASFIETELIRIAVKKAIIAPIANALGGAFADGGIMTSGGPVALNKYANGGIANSPQLALFGEGRTPEAYVPLPDGRTIPVTVKNSQPAAAGGGSPVSISVAVNISGDGTGASSAESESAKGRALGNLIATTVRQTLIQEKRPGGLIA